MDITCWNMWGKFYFSAKSPPNVIGTGTSNEKWRWETPSVLRMNWQIFYRSHKNVCIILSWQTVCALIPVVLFQIKRQHTHSQTYIYTYILFLNIVSPFASILRIVHDAVWLDSSHDWFSKHVYVYDVRGKYWIWALCCRLLDGNKLLNLNNLICIYWNIYHFVSWQGVIMLMI